MSVICFSSLKGGVGKTSISVNVAHALAERGCQVLLIDLDPMGHASRLFRSNTTGAAANESPLARLFLTCEIDPNAKELGNIIETAIAAQVSLVSPVREGLALLPAGPELRHFLWGRGARVFKELFTRLLSELSCSYDYVIIDTPPEFNVLSRNAIAASDLAVVPVDASAMSIFCLEEIIQSAAHIKTAQWAIVRSMVTKQASRMHKLTSDRLGANLRLQDTASREEESDDSDDLDISDPAGFMSMLNKASAAHKKSAAKASLPAGDSTSPIYLLRSMIYRSEQQNRLSFTGRTAFDSSREGALRNQYAEVASEIENILSLSAEDDPLLDVDENFSTTLGIQ